MEKDLEKKEAEKQEMVRKSYADYNKDAAEKVLGGKGLGEFSTAGSQSSSGGSPGARQPAHFRDRTGERQFGVGFLPARCLHQVSADRFLF